MKAPQTRNANPHRILAIVIAVGFVATIGPTATAQVIEDFGWYSDTPALQAVWPFATSLDTTTANPSTGTQSMYKQSFDDLEIGLFVGGFETGNTSIWSRTLP